MPLDLRIEAPWLVCREVYVDSTPGLNVVRSAVSSIFRTHDSGGIRISQMIFPRLLILFQEQRAPFSMDPIDMAEPEGVPFESPLRGSRAGLEVASRSVSSGEDEVDSDEVCPPMTRVAEKRPRAGNMGAYAMWHPKGQDSDLVVQEDPDLEEVFSAADTDVYHRIRICRTYANYLAAKLKTKRTK